jgi:CPA1 family monovalent cation:H+ antiporter
MDLFDILAILVSLAAVFSWLNYKLLNLPPAIGLMFSALVMSIVLLALGPLSGGLEDQVKLMLSSLDFNETLLHGMLSFMLFAGALHVNLDDLAQQRWTIAILATASVISATLLIGVGSQWLFGLIGLDLPLMACLVFGALISPTDPIAVLEILKSAGVPKTLETKITGESLFNDGVAVVLFLVLLQLPAGGADLATIADALTLFVVEAAGGVVYGLALGGIAYWMLKQVDNYTVEVLITLAVTTAGYDLAEGAHISAPTRSWWPGS